MEWQLTTKDKILIEVLRDGYIYKFYGEFWDTTRFEGSGIDYNTSIQELVNSGHLENVPDGKPIGFTPNGFVKAKLLIYDLRMIRNEINNLRITHDDIEV